MTGKTPNFTRRPHRCRWKLPAAMMAAGVLLACVAAGVDLLLQNALKDGMQPGGTGRVLMVVAISAITLAGLVFPVSIAVVSQASRLYGTRLLRNFMADCGNLTVLGIFLSTFLYSLLLIAVTHENAIVTVIPRVSLGICLLLAILCAVALIWFIQRLASNLQSPAITATLASDLLGEIDLMYPDPRPANGPEDDEDDDPPAVAEFSSEGVALPARISGYIQQIDLTALVSLAQQHDCLIRMKRQAGHFVTQDDVLLTIHPRPGQTAPGRDAFLDAFVISHDRTPQQDVEFCVNQIVEVALRALSAGINDPFTAMNCVDWLGSATARLAGRKTPSRFHCDAQGQLRVITEQSTFAGFVDSAFDQIRQTGWHHVAVSIRILQVLANVVPHLRTTEQKKIIQTHVELVYGQALDSVRTEYDLRDLKATYARASEALRKALGWNKPRLA